MAKRGNGEGSVYRRKDNNWVAAITLPTHLGGKKSITTAKPVKNAYSGLMICVNPLEKEVTLKTPI